MSQPEKNNHRVLVTGSSRGIGAAIALKLADNGFEIAVHCHSNLNAAEVVLEKLMYSGGSGNILSFDIADRAACKQILESDIEQNGAFYGVVCNAGVADDGAFPALLDSQWDHVLRTNLDGFYNVLRPLIMPMIRLRQGGRIVTMSSVSGLIGNRGQVNYSAAKAGIIGASKALAVELAKRNITVNCVAPGVIESDMTEDINEAEAKKIIPMNRFGQVEDVAALVNFLVSDQASYITRQVFGVNGGIC